MKKAVWKEYGTVVAISVAGSAITTYFTCPECVESPERYMWVTVFSASLWIFLWIGNGELTQRINHWISWVKYPLRRLVIGVFSTVVYTVTVVMALTLLWEYLFQFSFGSYSGVLFPSLLITFFISLFLHGRAFLMNWRESAVNAERLQRESVQAQYSSLRNQVNPHFLFNSLNALTHLVHQNPDQAVKFIKQLSDVYRYVLATRDQELVSLHEEIQFLNSYMYLQQIRFGDKLNLTVNLKDVEGQVAPLALQMLIENAIKHNVIAEEQPLRIRVFTEQNRVVVENNLQRRKIVADESSGVGLENIKKRYGFLTSLPVLVQEDSGLFRVSLPMIA
jgi:sensor histidine kinase YesM